MNSAINIKNIPKVIKKIISVDLDQATLYIFPHEFQIPLLIAFIFKLCLLLLLLLFIKSLFDID